MPALVTVTLLPRVVGVILFDIETHRRMQIYSTEGKKLLNDGTIFGAHWTYPIARETQAMRC